MRAARAHGPRRHDPVLNIFSADIGSPDDSLPCSMRPFHRNRFVLPLPENHRFPMEKYRLLRERVARREDVTLAVPEPATSEDLARVH